MEFKLKKLKKKDSDQSSLEVMEGWKSNETNEGSKSIVFDDFIEVCKGMYINADGSRRPLIVNSMHVYKKQYHLSYKKKKIVYGLPNQPTGSDDPINFYIAMGWRENQRFLWLQNSHWLQKEENVRYLVNLIFLIIGVFISWRSITA